MKVLRVLVSLSFGMFIIGSPALAAADVYLIYPFEWCDGDEGDLLHFTAPELGISQVYSFSNPSHGRVFPSLDQVNGGYYLPRCQGLLNAEFDFFQVVGADGEIVHVTVLLSNDEPQERTVEEGAEGGTLASPWTQVDEDPETTERLQIVEWLAGGMSGDYGFWVGNLETDSYITFQFDEATDTYQPPAGLFGEGNNGVETRIIIRPPTFPSSFLFVQSGFVQSGFVQSGFAQSGLFSNDSFGVQASTGGEQIIYAAGFFDGSSTPSTALRLRQSDMGMQIRAEAESTQGTVFTGWCTLDGGVANRVVLHHQQTLDGNDQLKLTVGEDGLSSCEENAPQGFFSAYPPAREHRFGVMGPQFGGVSFEFDEVMVKAKRYGTDLVQGLMDDFEQGGWNEQWEAVNPISLDVNAYGAHNGLLGLEVKPTQSVSSFLKHTFPEATDQLACRFNLDAAITSEGAAPGRVQIFSGSTDGSGDEVRLWVREVNSAYQLRAHSGSSSSGWLPLHRLPSTVDLSWDSGRLSVWIEGCGPSDCDTGHVVVDTGQVQELTKVKLGAISVHREVSGSFTVDDVMCLKGQGSG